MPSHVTHEVRVYLLAKQKPYHGTVLKRLRFVSRPSSTSTRACVCVRAPSRLAKPIPQHLAEVAELNSYKMLEERAFEHVMQLSVTEVNTALQGAVRSVEAAERAAKGTQSLINVAIATGREKAERKMMENEETRQRGVDKEIKVRQHERLARHALLRLCQTAWKKGALQKQFDQEIEAKRIAQQKNVKAEAEQRRAQSRRRHQAEAEAAYTSPWEAALGGSSVERFKQLVSEEAVRRRNQEGRSFSLDDRDRTTGSTLLLCACAGGHHHLTKFLIEHGAEVNLANNTVYRVSPLHEACQSNFVQVCNLRGAVQGAGDSERMLCKFRSCAAHCNASHDHAMPRVLHAPRDTGGRRADSKWCLVRCRGHGWRHSVARSSTQRPYGSG